jgi:hypothetical protein
MLYWLLVNIFKYTVVEMAKKTQKNGRHFFSMNMEYIYNVYIDLKQPAFV